MDGNIAHNFSNIGNLLHIAELHNFGDGLRNQLSQLLGIGRAAGADYVEIFIEKRNYQSISAQNGVISGISPSISTGVGVKTSLKGNDGYSCTSALTSEELLECLENALSIIGLSLPTPSQKIPEVDLEPLRDYVVIGEKIKHSSNLPSISQIKDKLLQVSDQMKQKIADLENYSCGYFQDLQEVLVASSDGVFARDLRVINRLTNSSLAAKNGSRSSIGRTAGGTLLPDLLKNFDVEKTVAEMSEASSNMLTAEYVEAGEYPVILGPGFGGVIFHEACGHLLETTAVAKESSPFTKMKGQQIANSAVTAWDEGKTDHAYGSIDMDDEGMPSQKTLLIENGILRNFMADRSGSLKTGHPRTASGRRQNFSFAPASRMRNTWIAPGDYTKDQLISSIDKGIYCQTLGGGSVNPTGDFNFAALEAWLIENGKLVKPLKGATIVGSAKNVLKDISMCGNDLDISSGHCGSVSGRIYTTVGQPHLKVDKITIGGR